MEKVRLLTALITIIAMSGCDTMKEEVQETKLGEIQEVLFTDVHFTDRFWLPRMEINRTVSIPSAFHQCENNGRFDNFALAGGLIIGEHQGDFSFDDTDPYKIIEGASYSLAVQYDPKLDAYLDSIIDLISAAQESDGYLTTCVTNKCTRLSGWWGSSRWEKINSHELYNCGHLYEAAIAHFMATGKKSLLNVAIKNADLICEVFGLGEGQIKYPSGHPIIEMALVKLYKVTRDEKYLKQARYFVDEAGRLSNGRSPGIYSQDHKPVMEQEEIVGHAVRAGYFYSGVADVAIMQQDTALFEAAERIWNNMAAKKLYINGGIGSRAQGEGFGPEYELNNFNNYCETCASIANVYWNHRMFLGTGQAKYIDVLERTLYNGVIAGVSLSGDKFFYDNPLASNGGHNRSPWFGCACCPGNITRFMASVPGYTYAINQNDIYVNLYVESHATLKLQDREVELKQKTDYPWDGNIEISVYPSQSGRFTLLLRLPGWATNRPVPTDLYSYTDKHPNTIRLTINGKSTRLKTRSGYAVIEREWNAGDKVNLLMDMPIRRIQAHHKVKYNKGLLGMERGPILYALEGIDQNKEFVFNLVIPRHAKIKAHYDEELLNGVVTLEGEAYSVEKDSLSGKTEEKACSFKAIPYNTWNNRGNSQLVVWIPESASYALPRPDPTPASRARQIGGWGFNDQFEPKSSDDLNTPYHYWWLKSGTEESIGYLFDKPERISATEVYWLAFDHYDVSYKAPESWKLLYKEEDEWKEVKNPSAYGVELNQYNMVTFDPVITSELKLVVQLQRAKTDNSTQETSPQKIESPKRKGFSGGVIEWKVYE